MKTFGGLFEKVVDPEHLERSMKLAARGKRKREPVQRFLNRADRELPLLGAELRAGTYRPRPYSQFKIKDPKPRIITRADFRDRVVHHAVCGVIAPLLERRFVDGSYACRVGKGAHRAVLAAQRFSRCHRYFWKSDISRYYDSVDHEVLLAMLGRTFREPRLNDLLSIIVTHKFPGQQPGKGLPIGNLTSQWFANFYLDQLDHFVKEDMRIQGYLRYMDDFVAWADDKGQLFELWRESEGFLRDHLKLRIKGEATHVAPVTEGLAFLGMRVFPGTIRLQHGRKHRMLRLIRRREQEYLRGERDACDLSASVQSSVGLVRYFGASLVRSLDLTRGVSMMEDGEGARTGSNAAGVGTTTPRTAVRRIATTTPRPTATTTWASAPRA